MHHYYIQITRNHFNNCSNETNQVSLPFPSSILILTCKGGEKKRVTINFLVFSENFISIFEKFTWPA